MSFLLFLFLNYLHNKIPDFSDCAKSFLLITLSPVTSSIQSKIFLSNSGSRFSCDLNSNSASKKKICDFKIYFE